MRRRWNVLVLVPALLVGIAACGDDDGGGDGAASGSGVEVELTSEEQAFADAWAATLSDDDGEGPSFDEADAQCMGNAIMAEIGTEPFDEAGVEASDIDVESDEDESPGEVLGTGVITDAQADAILEVWDGCTDLNSAFVELVAADSELDDGARDCLLEGLEEGDLVAAGFKASLTNEDGDPPEEVVTALVSLLGSCGGDGEGEGGILVDSIAESLAADGNLTEEQARCLAQAMVDDIGLDRLLELGMGGGELEDADPAVQQEMAGAILGAAEACDVSLNELGG